MNALTGECPCGALSYYAAAPSVWTVYCHCNACRDSSGSPSLLWVGFPSDAIEIRGWVLWEPGRSIHVLRGFCSQCGAAMIYRDRSMLQEETYVNGATAHDRGRIKPMGHAFWRERVGAYHCVDDLPRWDTYSRERRERLILSVPS